MLVNVTVVGALFNKILSTKLTNKRFTIILCLLNLCLVLKADERTSQTTYEFSCFDLICWSIS